jgi:glycosyltransferase involved in cell wall biosynthesis
MNRTISSDTLLSIVAPVYNEADVLERFVEELFATLTHLRFPGRCELLLINDGSTDGSREILDRLANDHPDRVRALHLSRNFGHAAATTAGLEHARGDLIILMDSDMQDDPAAFGAFFTQWRAGYDVVYAVRVTRTEGLVHRCLFAGFYRLLGWFADINLPRDAGNYSLLDRRVAEQLRTLPERNRYLPGLRRWVGFRQIGVPVPRRTAYRPKGRVGLRGQWRLAMNAIFSFSYVPLFVFRFAGVASMALSLGLIIFALVQKFRLGTDTSSWFSLLVSISFFGGMNLFGIGVLGEYVARIYDQVKRRPAYLLDRITGAPSRLGNHTLRGSLTNLEQNKAEEPATPTAARTTSDSAATDYVPVGTGTAR